MYGPFQGRKEPLDIEDCLGFNASGVNETGLKFIAEIERSIGRAFGRGFGRAFGRTFSLPK